MQKQETVLWTEFVWRMHANQETAFRDERCYSFVHVAKEKCGCNNYVRTQSVNLTTLPYGTKDLGSAFLLIQRP
jgi:hypothetical protein